MAEYIDKQLLLDSMQKSLDSSPDGYAVVGVYGFCVAMQVIDKYPAADVVPVVRCKDCRYSMDDKIFGGMWCRGRKVTPDWFCADGEKRDGET